jgi:ABC-2 type transport system permease protein
MVGNESLIKKVYFPRWVLPASSILACLIGFLVELLVLIVAIAIVGNIALEFVPMLIVLVLLETGFVLGIGLALSVANAYFRDIQHFLGIFLNVWFYATPILYPLETVPEEANVLGMQIPVRDLVRLNPMSSFTDAFRDVLYHLRNPTALQLLGLTLAALTSLALGTAAFRRLEPRLAEEL